ncbi:MAG: hypothetical protein FIB08_11165 [Candidatus Methanoperedens sp.]|nr:hypothetical protein [Candidatus Methanoperedens sp.]
MTISARLCSGRTAFEVTTNIKMDLIRVSRVIETKIATKHILLVNYMGVEISMYPSGRMIIKAGSREESLDIAKKLLAELGLDEKL